jgi:type IX secretion system PorP/SprF family membrane protein
MSCLPITIFISIMKQPKIILTLLIILTEVTLHAQEEPMYSQYFFNSSVINPAQAGASGSNQAGVLVRNQWVGVSGAPKTITAYANIRLPRQLGLAVGIYQDKLGPETNLLLQTDLAYHANLSEEWHLAAGVRFSASYTRVGLTEVANVDPRNPFFTMDISSGLKLNTGVGVLVYSSRSFFGISLPKAFRTQISVSAPGVAEFEKTEVRTLFAYGGSNIKLSQDFMFTPSAMVRISTIPAQLDLNAIFGYKDIIDFGPLVRSNLTQIDN